MPRPTIKDLFGKTIRQRRPRFEAALERADRRTLADRAARVRWLYRVIPKNVGFGLPLETAFVFEEAQYSFTYGNFVAVIVLAASFVEHWFASNLASRGFGKEASRGLAASIKCARINNLVDPLILDKADQLRLIRNPFAHLKDSEHPHTVGRRAVEKRTDLMDLVENDAKEAITAMFGVALYAFRRS